MQKVSKFFQIFFKLVVIFFLVLVWARFFIKSLLWSVIVSAIITAIIDLFTRIVFTKKSQKNELKSKEKEDAENIFLSLAIDDNGLKFFTKLYQKNEQFSRHLVSTANAELYFYKRNDVGCITATCFSLSPLSVQQIATIMKYAKKNKAKDITILAGEIQKDCFSFIKIFDEKITLLNKYETYDLIYKKEGQFPPVTRQPQKEKKYTIKEMFMYSLNPARAKGYFFSALALFFCSLFTRLTIYYSITISILLLLSLVSLTSPISRFQAHKDNQAKHKNI